MIDLRQFLRCCQVVLDLFELPQGLDDRGELGVATTDTARTGHVPVDRRVGQLGLKVGELGAQRLGILEHGSFLNDDVVTP